jgi:hypothetical protein
MVADRPNRQIDHRGIDLGNKDGDAERQQRKPPAFFLPWRPVGGNGRERSSGVGEHWACPVDPDWRIAGAADGVERKAGAGFAAFAHDLEPAATAVEALGDGGPSIKNDTDTHGVARSPLMPRTWPNRRIPFG